MSGPFPAAKTGAVPAKLGSGFYGNPSHSSSIRNALSKQADTAPARGGVAIAPSKLTKQASVPAGLGSARPPPSATKGGGAAAAGGGGAGAATGYMSPGRQTPGKREGDACATCGGILEPEEACVQAMGQKYHTHHFLCSQCNCQLAGQCVLLFIRVRSCVFLQAVWFDERAGALRKVLRRSTGTTAAQLSHVRPILHGLFFF